MCARVKCVRQIYVHLCVLQVIMPESDTGPKERISSVVSMVGDAKWIWSMMGCVVNWVRLLLSGPFPRASMLQECWIPAVYDREFYSEVVRLDEDIQRGRVDVPTGLDVVTMRRQLDWFCRNDLGFILDDISLFASKFGWEGVTVGSLHMGTAIKNTMSHWLTGMDCMGRRVTFDRMLQRLRVSKVITKTKTRVTASGIRIVDCRTSADHGDYHTAIVKEKVWGINHPDVQTKKEFRHNCDMYQCDHNKQSLLEAVAKFHQVDWRFMDMVLMDAHVHREMILTVFGEGNETHTRYLELVRVYDPTALTFQNIHGSLRDSELQ